MEIFEDEENLQVGEWDSVVDDEAEGTDKVLDQEESVQAETITLESLNVGYYAPLGFGVCCAGLLIALGVLGFLSIVRKG